MKIEKLLPLSQFIDQSVSEVNNSSVVLDRIQGYNDFLKQPLTKEMFVNQLGEWNMSKNGLKDSVEYRAWQEAEKKVIFDGHVDGEYYINNNYSYNLADTLSQNETLFELANGKLTLKNVTI